MCGLPCGCRHRRERDELEPDDRRARLSAHDARGPGALRDQHRDGVPGSHDRALGRARVALCVQGGAVGRNVVDRVHLHVSARRAVAPGDEHVHAVDLRSAPRAHLGLAQLRAVLSVVRAGGRRLSCALWRARADGRRVRGDFRRHARVCHALAPRRDLLLRGDPDARRDACRSTRRDQPVPGIHVRRQRRCVFRASGRIRVRLPVSQEAAAREHRAAAAACVAGAGRE